MAASRASAQVRAGGPAGRYNYDPTRVHLWGQQSAGAALCLVAGATYEQNHGAKPSALLLDCPFVDSTCSSASYARNSALNMVAAVGHIYR